MPAIPIYQVDAFAESVFAGNPAAVCPLDAWLDDATLQRVAAENNLSETAFFVARDDEAYDLRWFTPTVEVPLCGHATLASGHVVLNHLDPDRDAVTFHSQSGPLAVRRDGTRLSLDFPAYPPAPVEDEGLLERVAGALGARPTSLMRHEMLIAVYDDEATVAGLRPDIAAVAAADADSIAATAPGDAVDFVSRFFAPHYGIPEDPVTGALHTRLVPYWAARLGKDDLTARQISARGGALWCRLAGERVRLAGHAADYMTGTIRL